MASLSSFSHDYKADTWYNLANVNLPNPKCTRLFCYQEASKFFSSDAKYSYETNRTGIRIATLLMARRDSEQPREWASTPSSKRLPTGYFYNFL
jgi:hypothetical protein